MIKKVMLFFFLCCCIQHIQPKEIAPEEHFLFQYEHADLIDIINELAKEKATTVLLPQGKDAITEKITFSLKKEVSLEKAWELLVSILNITGYSVVPHKDTFVITKTDKNITREPFDLFIGTEPEQLPLSDKQIRYMYYFSNIKVSKGSESELEALFKIIMPPESLFEIDSATNAVILVGRSKEIKAFMEIALKLDQVEFQEKIEFIELRFADAITIASLINENILNENRSNINRYRLDTKKQPKIPYFSKFTKVIPVQIQNRNALIVLGRLQAVERMKDFIKNNLDINLSKQNSDTQSILHMYQLQYLDAETFAPILENIISSSRTRKGQSSAGKKTTGTERFFDEVIIKADKPRNAEELKYYGGNKLLIACRNEDWKQIKKLIEELDSPQPQVLIEILVADLSIDDTRLLGANMRTPGKIPLFGDIEFQAAHLSPGILTDSVSNPMTIEGDLLRQGVDSSGNQVDTSVNNTSAASLSPSGSTLLSLSDNNGKTWSILQVLQLFSHSKILSHPHVIATNNKQSVLEFGQTKRLRDEGSSSLGGSTIVRFKEEAAKLVLKITPRISAGDTVNLEIEIDINEFIEGSDAKTIRSVQTNLNAKNESIVAIGGLVSVDTQNSTTKTPLLANVPILGRFFKRQRGQMIKNSLIVFISPIIIQPRLRNGLNKYTKDYIEVARGYSQQSDLFDGLKDPITRWFFKTESESETYLKNFVKHDTQFSQELEHNNSTTQYKTNACSEEATEETASCPVSEIEIKPTESSIASQQKTVAHSNLHTENKKINTTDAIDNGIDLEKILENEDNPFITKVT